MKFRILLPALFALALFAVACSPPPVLRNDKMLRDDSLLTDQPCEAPCWRSITPGETTWADAIRVIENDSTLTNLEIQNAQEGNAKLATWRGVDGETCCQMYTEDGSTVQSLLLLLTPEIRLGDLIKSQGEPDYVVGSEVTGDQAVMNLFFTDVPMLIYAFVAGADSGALSESSEIIGVLLLTPEDMDLLTKTNNLHTWDGYRSYRTYMERDFDVTPSITLTPTPSQ